MDPNDGLWIWVMEMYDGWWVWVWPMDMYTDYDYGYVWWLRMADTDDG